MRARTCAGPRCNSLRRVELVALDAPFSSSKSSIHIDQLTISPTPRISRSTLSGSVRSAMRLMLNASISARKGVMKIGRPIMSVMALWLLLDVLSKDKRLPLVEDTGWLQHVTASACVVRRNGRASDSNDLFILRVLSPASRGVVDDGADEVLYAGEEIVNADEGQLSLEAGTPQGGPSGSAPRSSSTEWRTPA